MTKHELYSSFCDTIKKWIIENNIEPSEENYEIMENVVCDYGESWYRQSLGKNMCIK